MLYLSYCIFCFQIELVLTQAVVPPYSAAQYHFVGLNCSSSGTLCLMMVVISCCCQFGQGSSCKLLCAGSPLAPFVLRNEEDREGRGQNVGRWCTYQLVLGNNLWYIRDYIMYCSTVVLGIQHFKEYPQVSMNSSSVFLFFLLDFCFVFVFSSETC